MPLCAKPEDSHQNSTTCRQARNLCVADPDFKFDFDSSHTQVIDERLEIIFLIYRTYSFVFSLIRCLIWAVSWVLASISVQMTLAFKALGLYLFDLVCNSIRLPTLPLHSKLTWRAYRFLKATITWMDIRISLSLQISVWCYLSLFFATMVYVQPLLRMLIVEHLKLWQVEPTLLIVTYPTPDKLLSSILRKM